MPTPASSSARPGAAPPLPGTARPGAALPGAALPGAALPPLVEPGPDLDAGARARYARHLLLPGFGADAQRRLANAAVLVVGVGGLGAPVLAYLAAAGVGRIGIADPDVVELTNLQRQVIHTEAALGRPKVDSATAFVHGLNPAVEVVAHPVRVDADNADELVAGYDLVIDGTDNFSTRYLMNDTCVRLRRPYVWASILRWDGQLSVFWAGYGPCLRCVFPQPPDPGLVPSCAEGGVLGVVCGSVGSAQALEAVKIITGTGEPMVGRIAVFNASRGTWRDLPVVADERCPTCGSGDREQVSGKHLSGGQPDPDRGDGTDAVPAGPLLGAGELARWLAERAAGERDFVLVDVRTPGERSVNQIAGSVTTDALDTLDDTTAVVVHCKSGARSARAAAALRSERTGPVWDLAGGIDAWIDEIEPDQPRY